MYSETDIIARAWMVVEVVNMCMSPREVDKVFLIGSYAAGNATDWSDLDFLIELKQEQGVLNSEGKLVVKNYYPSWDKIKEIHKKIDNTRIHVIFGSEEAAKSLHEKHKHEKKPYIYRELKIGGLNASSHSPDLKV